MSYRGINAEISAKRLVSPHSAVHRGTDHLRFGWYRAVVISTVNVHGGNDRRVARTAA